MTGAKKITAFVWWGIALNLLLVGLKSYGGFFGHSEALLADALESAGDVFASSLLLLGLRYAALPADDNHPYGHGRAESLFVFVVVALLMVSVSVIVYRSVVNLYTPHELPERFTLVILVATIISKEILFRVASRAARKANSHLVRSDAFHHRSDAITSLAGLIGVGLAIGLGKGHESADDYAALLSCGFIVYGAYKIFRPALGEIMDEQVHNDLVREIRTVAGSVEGVLGTEKCFVRKSGTVYYVDLHISVNANISVYDGHAIAHELQSAIKQRMSGIAQVLVHVEPHEPIDPGLS